MALAGHLFSVKTEDPSFCKTFCREFYGLSSGDARDCAEWIQRLYAIAPDRWYLDCVVTGDNIRTGRFTREDARRSVVLRDNLAIAGKGLAPFVRKASTNSERLNDVMVSIKILERVARFGVANRKKTSLGSGKKLNSDVLRSWKRVRQGEPCGTPIDIMNAL